MENGECKMAESKTDSGSNSSPLNPIVLINSIVFPFCILHSPFFILHSGRLQGGAKRRAETMRINVCVCGLGVALVIALTGASAPSPHGIVVEVEAGAQGRK